MAREYWLRRLTNGFLAFVFACGSISALLPALPTAAAGELEVIPITWDVVGLDSNRPLTSGPELFPVGAQVCNTSGAPRDITARLEWADANAATIKERPGSLTALTFPAVPDGACVDAYFEIQITRSELAYGETRGYSIIAAYDNGGTPVEASTPAGRQIIVESLVSQNRNATMEIRYCDPNAGGSGTCDQSSGTGWLVLGGGSSINLAVGNTYLIELTTVTATAYEEVQSFLTLSNTIFQVLSVSTEYSTLTAPPERVSTPNPQLWGDACLWDSDPASPSYHSCLSTGKAGGTVVTLYEIRIISGGGESVGLEALIYDRSGGSFHYNTDYSLSPGDITIFDPTTNADFTKRFIPATIAAGGTATLRFTITNPNPVTVTGYAFTDPLPSGMVVATPANDSSTCSGTVSTGTDGGTGRDYVTFTDGVIGANSSCTVLVDVTVAAAGDYPNTSGSLTIGGTDTGETAEATLVVTTEPPPPLVCTNLPAGTTLAAWATFNSATAPSPTSTYPGVTANAGSGPGLTFSVSADQLEWQAKANTTNQTLANARTTGAYYEFQLDTNGVTSVDFSLEAFRRNGNAPSSITLEYGPLGGALTQSTTFSPVPTQNNRPGTSNFFATNLTALNPSGMTVFRVYAYGATNINQPISFLNALIQGTGTICTPLPESQTPPNPPQLTKAFNPATAYVGEEATLSFTLSNPNAAAALSGVTFRDELPFGMTAVPGSFVNTGCGGSWGLEDSNPGVLLFTDGALAAGASCTLSVNVVASSTGNNLNFSDPIDARETLAGNSAEATLDVNPPPATPSIIKLFDPNPLFNPAGSTTLTFRITNNDLTLTIEEVAFTDVLPAVSSVQMIPVEPFAYSTNGECGAAHSFTWSSSANALSFSGGEIAARRVCEITLNVEVPGVDISGGPVTFPNETSAVSHVFNETILYGNTAEDTLLVDGAIPGIALRKEVGLGNAVDGTWSNYTEVEVNENVYYKLIIENIGEMVLTNITVSDPMVDTSACPWTASGFNLPVADISAPEAHIATCIVGPVAAEVGVHPNIATADSAETDPVTDDADYEGYYPTAVELLRFEAIAQGEDVRITWETATELENLGFNLYGSTTPAGPWVQVNPAFIPAQNPGAVSGAVYKLLDTEVTPGVPVYYRLEDVDIHGASTFHGPISVTLSNPSAVSLTSFSASSGAFDLLPALLALGALSLTRKRRK